MDTSNFKEVFTSDEVKKLRAENEMLYYEAQRLDSLATDFAKRTEYWIGRCNSWQNDCEQLRQRVAVLEAQLEKNNPLLDEAADAIDKLTAERDELLKSIALAMPVMDAHAGPSRLADFHAAIASVKEMK